MVALSWVRLRTDISVGLKAPMRDTFRLLMVLAAGVVAAGCDESRGPAAPSAVVGGSATASTVRVPRGLDAASSALTVPWSSITGSGPGGTCGSGPSGWVRSPGFIARAVPGPPANLVPAVVGMTVTLGWDAPVMGDPVSSYVIDAGSSAGFADLASFDTGGVATALTVTGVPSATYFIRVRARNAAGTSPASNEVIVAVGSASPCAFPPDAPTGLSPSVAGTTLTLTWFAPSSGCAPTAYAVQAGSAPGLSDLADARTGSPATGFSADNVPDGTYHLRVRGANGAGLGPPSNEVVAIVGAGPIPDPPVLSVPIVDLQGAYDPATGRLGSLLCTFKFPTDPNDRWCFHAFGSSTVPGKRSPSYDYKTVAGAMVVAATAGTVTRIDAESNPLYPGEFEIETRANASYLVIYDHVKNVTVGLGSIVSPGSPHGTVGIHTSGPTVWGRVELQVNRITQLQPTIQSVAVCPRDYGTPSFNGRNDAALAAHNGANPAFAASSTCVP